MHILRRQGSVAEDLDLRRASPRLIKVYAYYIEPPLAQRWRMTQVITGDGRDFTPFVAIDRRLGRLHIA